MKKNFSRQFKNRCRGYLCKKQFYNKKYCLKVAGDIFIPSDVERKLWVICHTRLENIIEVYEKDNLPFLFGWTGGQGTERTNVLFIRYSFEFVSAANHRSTFRTVR